MIEKLRSIAIFATVVEQGTFRAAAFHLGLAPSRISETVSELEKDLGVTLLYRSTRQLSLSHEGRTLYESAKDMLNAAETGLDALSPQSDEPAGVLRVTAPAFCTQTEMMDAISEFSRSHPKVQLELKFTDRPQDLIREGIDVGIRAGWLKDSDLMTRGLGQIERVLVASPDYLAERAPIAHPTDLEELDWIRFEMRPAHTVLHAKSSDETCSVLGKSMLKVNSADSLYELAARGLGVTAIPENLAKRGFQRGELVQVLPEWTLEPLGMHAVWPNTSRKENLTLIFVRFLADAHKAAEADS